MRANLSPIWALSPTAGLSGLVDADVDGRPPDTRATDEHGVHHRVWRITSPAVVDGIREAVAVNPVLVADGHHRYEIGLAYQEEIGAGTGTGGQDRILAFVVELHEAQLSVRAIHRVLRGLPAGFDLLGALEPHFEVFETAPVDATILGRMDDAGALGLVTPAGTWLLRPLPATARRGRPRPRLEPPRRGPGRAPRARPHVPARVRTACSDFVLQGDAGAAILLRPATVDQIATISHGGERMPPKTTFFYPKPATGLVFRDLDLG